MPETIGKATIGLERRSYHASNVAFPPRRGCLQRPLMGTYASGAVHIGLYAGVFGIVLSGLGVALGYGMDLGRMFTGATVGLHELFLAILPPLLGIHILGAFWYKFIRRDGVLERMARKLAV